MSRIDELRDFVKHSGRSETLELPHDTARQLLVELELAMACAYVDAQRAAALCDSQDADN